MAYYEATTSRTTRPCVAGPPMYQKCGLPCIEAGLDAHALTYAPEHTHFSIKKMTPQGDQRAAQRPPERACARKQPAVFRCEQGSRPRTVRQQNTFAFAMVRRPATGKDFEPSWRLSEPTGPRSVSAFRVAFLPAEVTEWRLRSKPATPRCTPCTPRCTDGDRRTCPAGWSIRRGKSFCTCYRPT